MDGSHEPSTGHGLYHRRANVNPTAPDAETSLTSARPPLRDAFTRWPSAADIVLAIALFLMIVFVSFEEPHDDLVILAVSEIPLG